jgi:hypothetical protein
MEDAGRFLFLDDSIAIPEDAVGRSFLSPFNTRVDMFNQLMLDMLLGVEQQR